MVGYFLDKGVRHVGDRDVPRRRRRHVHRICPDTAEGNHFALFQAVDNILADAHTFGNDGIGVMGDFNKLILRTGWNFHNLCTDWGEGFELQLVASA
jgi:hypothetical protein